jgi:hypothetical protein
MNALFQRQRRLRSCAVVVISLVSLAATGCDTQQYAPAVADFGTATATVVQQTKNAYTVVSDAVMQQQILALTERTTPIQTDPTKEFAPFLSADDVAIRETLLDGLQAYASGLGNITGKTGELSTETTKLAGSLKDLAGNERLQHSFRETASVPPEALNAGAAGVQFVGQFLIDRKIARDLPGILAKADPSIQGVAELFVHEIGNPPSSVAPGGLRGKLGRTYDGLVMTQTLIVNAKSAGSAEKQQAVRRLAELIAAQRTSDAALAATQASLKKLVSAHHALLQVQAAPSTFKTEIASLWAQIKAAQDFYSQLPGK